MYLIYFFAIYMHLINIFAIYAHTYIDNICWMSRSRCARTIFDICIYIYCILHIYFFCSLLHTKTMGCDFKSFSSGIWYMCIRPKWIHPFCSLLHFEWIHFVLCCTRRQFDAISSPVQLSLVVVTHEHNFFLWLLDFNIIWCWPRISIWIVFFFRGLHTKTIWCDSLTSTPSGTGSPTAWLKEGTIPLPASLSAVNVSTCVCVHVCMYVSIYVCM